MSKDVQRLVGKQVVLLRKERDLTQAQLAERVGVATETVSRLERGVSVPSLKTLEAICNALHVTLEDFFAFELPQQSKGTTLEKELAKVMVLLKSKKPDEIRVGYEVLKNVFEAMRKG